jgi:hypothetical protein
MLTKYSYGRQAVPTHSASHNGRIKQRSSRMPSQISRTEEHTSLTQQLRSTSLQHAQTANITEVRRPIHLEPLTSKLLAKNNKKFNGLPTSTSIIGIFRPDLSNQCPADIIKQVTSEYEKSPRSANAQLLQQTINSYTSVDNVDSGLRKEIDKALAVLH